MHCGRPYRCHCTLDAANQTVTYNPAVDPVRFALWTLRDEVAQRRSPRWATRMPMVYAARCCSTYSRSASFIRVCQPSPVALKYSTTSGLYRTVTGTLVGFFCGPRWPGRRTLPLAQNVATDAASFGSYGHSISFTRSGAEAMAAAFCALLNAEGFKVGARFIFVTITTRNYSGALMALRPNQKDYAFAKPAQTLQSLFSIFSALIFRRNHRGVEYTTYLSQVNAVILEVLLSLGFVPGDHTFIVVTKCKSCQAFCGYTCPTHQFTGPTRKAPQADYCRRWVP